MAESGPFSLHRGPERDLGIDAPFDVRFVHRLRFTEDAFDPENPTVADALTAAPRGRPRLLVFIDDGVAEAWPDLAGRVRGYADRHRDRIDLVTDPITVAGGEAAKNDHAVTDTVVEAIHEQGICRQSSVMVIGGGAVLDAVGLGAATAHRGVRLIRLPTTTLSQGDGGLGVKNGINVFGKKNFLGTFAVPWAVINDRLFLRSLDDVQFRAGFSEAVKVGLIKDGPFFHRISAHVGGVRARDEALTDSIIRHSAELHLRHIVSGGDPFELTESRPLDFGHWSAHKLEQMTDFTVSHGDAVAVGVALDVIYSHLRGWISRADTESVLRCLEGLGFPLYDPALEQTETLLDGLEEFREHLGGQLTVMLLLGIGRPVEVHEMDDRLVREAINLLAQRGDGTTRAAGGA